MSGPESQAGRTYCGLLLDDNRSGVAGTSCWTWTSKGSLGDKDKQGGVQRARQCSQKGVQRAWENPGSHGGRQHGAQQASEHAPAHFRMTLGDPPEACPGAFGCARVIRATEGKQIGVPGTRQNSQNGIQKVQEHSFQGQVATLGEAPGPLPGACPVALRYPKNVRATKEEVRRLWEQAEQPKRRPEGQEGRLSSAQHAVQHALAHFWQGSEWLRKHLLRYSDVQK